MNYSYDEFWDRVKTIADDQDFKENEELLKLIPPEMYTPFYDALICGNKMVPAFSSLELSSELAQQLSMAQGDVYMVLPTFLELHYKLNPHEEPSNDPLANLMDAIDKVKNYSELTFMREHIEYRIDKYLNDLLKETSPALDDQWRKTCPACGFTVNMLNIACGRCGFSPEKS